MFVERKMSNFHNFLVRDFPYDESGRVKKEANCIGRQVVNVDGDEGATLETIFRH